MHTPDTQQKFIERRSQGWTYSRIATELGVARSTLYEWSRKFRFELHNRRAVELDELQDRLLGPTAARAAALAEKLGRVEAELRQRSLAQVSTARLFTLADSLRRELERTTTAANGLTFISPVKDIPKEEYVEEIQEWKP